MLGVLKGNKFRSYGSLMVDIHRQDQPVRRPHSPPKLFAVNPEQLLPPQPPNMSLPLRPSLLPQCVSCTRRLTNLSLHEWRPSQQQVRGKKKLANVPSTVTVRLLKDVKTFGRKGESLSSFPMQEYH